MRLRYFAAAMLIGSGIISCKHSNKEKIINKWRVVEMHMPSADRQLDSIMNVMIRGGIFEFTKDERYTLRSNSMQDSGKYRCSDDGKMVYLTTFKDGMSDTMAITELTDKKLILTSKSNGSRLTTEAVKK